jgi:hypothetical protein
MKRSPGASRNRTNNPCYLLPVLVFLSACTTPTPPPPAGGTLTGADEPVRFIDDVQYFRGTNLAFTPEVKAKLAAGGINAVDLTLAIQNQLSRDNLLASGADYVLVVAVEDLYISPIYNAGWFSYRAEDDRIGGRAYVMGDDSEEALYSFDVAASTDRKQAIEGGDPQRLAQLYQVFAERVVAAFRANKPTL